MSHGRKQLVYRASNTVIDSFEAMEEKLFPLGWRRKEGGNPSVRVYQHHRSTITLPDDFLHLSEIELYDIVAHSKAAFELQDISTSE